ncbi:hypothetical protein [Halococcus sp. PRR34]|uniref:hypothetical protein n=1 Tax=Halococcus sp. PRR34 TaxID=3020830 RepID=UPI002361550C|nr:hypothetical protein [Halococcus sp. PRR34]
MSDTETSTSDVDDEPTVESLAARVHDLEETVHGVGWGGLTGDENAEQRTRIKTTKQVIELAESHNDDGAPLQDVYSITSILGIEFDDAKEEVEKLRRQGEIYEPADEVVRVT